MYSLNTVKMGVSDFLDKEFLSKFKVGTVEKIVAGAFIGIAIHKIDNIIPKLKENPMFNFLEIVDDDNNIDVDLLLSVFKEQIGEDGVEVTIPLIDNNFSFVKKPITFYKSDIENLLECIKRRA